MQICLVGSAPSSVGLAPYDSPDWNIWACSPGAYGIARNVKAFFELHRFEPGQPWFSEGYCEFLRNFPGPVYMAEEVPSVKNCAVIPADDLVAKYGPYWFNSSLSWMFAMAIETILIERQECEKAGLEIPHSKIALYGVDMAASEEYYSQKLGCIRFAEIATEYGIEVGVPPESDLFTPPPLYGVCEVSHEWIKKTARYRELSARRQAAIQRRDQAVMEETFLNGALDDLNWSQQTWSGNLAARSKSFVGPHLGSTSIARSKE